MEIDEALVREARDARTSPERLKLLVSEHGALRMMVAQNPSAPIELLQDFYRQGEMFHFALVRNPNTPSEILLRLAAEYPEEFLENPALTLLLLESPTFFERLPYQFFSFFLERPDPPRIVLECAMSSPGLRHELARHPATPPELLGRLAKDPSHWIIQATAARLETPPDVLERLLYESSDVETCKIAAQNPSTPKEPLQFLHRMGFSQDFSQCTPPPFASTQEIERLLTFAPYFRCVLARFPELPEKDLAQLAKDESWLVRNELARRPKLSEELLAQLAQRGGAAATELLKRQDLPALLLATLAASPDLHTRTQVARRKDLPNEAIELLIKDASVQRELLLYQALRPEILDLFLDPDEASALIILRSEALLPSTIERLAAHKSAKVRCGVAAHPKTSATTLEALSKDKDTLTKKAVAKRAELSTRAIKRLSKSKDEVVREAAAQNPSSNQSILEEMATDPSGKVRLAVLNHPSSSRLIAELLSQDKDPNVAARAKARLAELPPEPEIKKAAPKKRPPKTKKTEGAEPK